MKRNSTNSNYMMGTIALLGILVFAIIPQASAMTAQTTVFPSIVAIGNDVVLTYEGQTLQDTHTVLLTRVHEPTANSPHTLVLGDSGAAGEYDDCADKIDLSEQVGEPGQWEARNFDGDDIGEPFQIFDLDEGEFVSFAFGKGLASIPVTTQGAVTVSANNIVWVDIFPGSNTADNLDLEGQYKWESCGTENSGIGDWETTQSIIVVIPVSGEILPISTTALLLAGVSTSAMWLVPAIGAFVGIGLTIYKVRRHN